MERTQVSCTPKSPLRAGLFLLLGLGLSMLALYVGHAAAPTSGPTSFLARPKHRPLLNVTISSTVTTLSEVQSILATATTRAAAKDSATGTS